MQRKSKKINLNLDGSRSKIGIVVSDFNQDITSKLLEGALTTLFEYKVKAQNVTVVHVPGTFEIPLACQKLAQTKKFNGLVALGCVLKGETNHNVYISNAAANGIMETMLDYNLPIGFGILTPDNLRQARERSTKESNKGAEAALATLLMIQTLTES